MSTTTVTSPVGAPSAPSTPSRFAPRIPLSAPRWNSRIVGTEVTAREAWLGYLLGPAGALLLIEPVPVTI